MYQQNKISQSIFMTTVMIFFAVISYAQSGDLPDPKKSPGDVLAVTKSDVCTPGYAGKVRNVPESEKKKVFAAYGILTHKPKEYEVDHLISLELGGSNSIKNLWPQSYLTSPWNAHVKDGLEDHLHSLVCKGELDLAEAQREIATDWIAAYKKGFSTALPLPAHSAPPAKPKKRSLWDMIFGR